MTKIKKDEVCDMCQYQYDEIKKIIRNHVEKHGDFWPDELALKHDLSVWAVLDAIEELAEEGYLEEKDRDVAETRLLPIKEAENR